LRALGYGERDAGILLAVAAAGSPPRRPSQ
jgi:hypothetical protein